MNKIKLMPYEWQECKGIIILDPDGWRVDNKSQFEPITKEEFDKRAAMSTIMPAAGNKVDTSESSD